MVSSSWGARTSGRPQQRTVRILRPLVAAAPAAARRAARRAALLHVHVQQPRRRTARRRRRLRQCFARGAATGQLAVSVVGRPAEQQQQPRAAEAAAAAAHRLQRRTQRAAQAAPPPSRAAAARGNGRCDAVDVGRADRLDRGADARGAAAHRREQPRPRRGVQQRHRGLAGRWQRHVTHVGHGGAQQMQRHLVRARLGARAGDRVKVRGSSAGAAAPPCQRRR